MVGSKAEAYWKELHDRERGCFVGLRSAELQYMALSVIRDYEEEIRMLRQRIQAIKSIYNSGASINELLPNELLVQIFRWVGPRFSTVDAVRLTHVCRSWRSVIHGTPVFWADLLNPDGAIFARHASDFWIVRKAFERSAQIPGLRFSLNGTFLSCLKTYPSLTSHISRISTLHLDCIGNKHRDLRPFIRLQMPNLEDLTVWLKCADARVTPADTPSNFPRLRRLRTNCVSFAVRWISPSARQLIIGQHWEEWGRSPIPKLVPCCTARKLDRLWDALRGPCADLTELRLDSCISDKITRPRDPPLELSKLETLLLHAHTSDIIQTLLNSMKLPETAQVTLISTFCPYDKLCSMGTGVPCIPKVDRLAIDMGSLTRHRIFNYVVRSYEDCTKQLTLCSYKDPIDILNPIDNSNPIDLLRFFQGSVSMFSPEMITELDVNFTQPLPGLVSADNAGWLWLFRRFPRIFRLKVETQSSYDLCTALAHDDVLPNLRIFTLHTGTDATAVNNEILMFVLEDRASRGLLLQSLYFARRVSSQEEAIIPPDVASNLRRRLNAIVPNFSFTAKWGPRGEGVIEDLLDGEV
ncbi:hypothetical protein OH76DRAFT_1560338 [Lentinus brumalis]|uniref:F-box domain-containing protein n=1 Tax=Lentinus brumalis TaxID=2498619 RepID=A0A371CT91_9APHY|nr:hypothetical protein OH76DRAFT_1560338 [Polyporus brumalis]